MAMDEQKNIPLLDCPVDYLIGDASGKVLNEYGRFPCKIKCGVLRAQQSTSTSMSFGRTMYSCWNLAVFC